MILNGVISRWLLDFLLTGQSQNYLTLSFKLLIFFLLFASYMIENQKETPQENPKSTPYFDLKTKECSKNVPHSFIVIYLKININ